MSNRGNSLPNSAALATALASRLAKMSPAAIANVQRQVQRWQATTLTKSTPSASRVWGKR